MNRTRSTAAGQVTLNTDPLAALRKELESAKSKRVLIGVLGGKDARNGDESKGYVPGNAEIGLIHEFGIVGSTGAIRYEERTGKERSATHQPSIPERSFLRMPLITKLPDAINAQGRALWRQFILTKGVSKALALLGVLGEAQVQDAFASGGFGTWPKLAKYTIKKKGSAAILIDTAQLRQSVTSRVVG